MLTAKELANRLGFDVRTIYRWTRDGRLPVHRFGKRSRYCWREVLEKGVKSEHLRTDCRKPGEPTDT